jgi:hypothetical protein
VRRPCHMLSTLPHPCPQLRTPETYDATMTEFDETGAFRRIALETSANVPCPSRAQ